MVRIKSNYIISVLVLISLLSFIGCGSIGYRGDRLKSQNDVDSISPGIYPGVRYDINSIGKALDPIAIREAEEWGFSGLAYLGVICLIIDTPISFGLDTVCLPYDMFQYHKKEDKQKNSDNNITNKTEHTIINNEK